MHIHINIINFTSVTPTETLRCSSDFSTASSAPSTSTEIHIYVFTEPRMRLAVRCVPKGALRTHSAQQAPLWGSQVTCGVYCLRERQCYGLVSFINIYIFTLLCKYIYIVTSTSATPTDTLRRSSDRSTASSAPSTSTEIHIYVFIYKYILQHACIFIE